MQYSVLQQSLKLYQLAGLVKLQLNAPKLILMAEYQRCLELGLSQHELNRLISIQNFKNLDLIMSLEIYTSPEKFSLQIIKAKAYHLAQVSNLSELKLAFPIIKDQKFDFRSKNSWSQCVHLLDKLTKNSQDFEKFKRDIRSLVTAIKTQQYHQLTGETAVEEAYDDLASYISCWKGAQWEYNLKSASTIDLLKRAWLEQFLSQHNLSRLLKSSYCD